MFAHHPLFGAGVGLHGSSRLRTEPYLTSWIDAREAMKKIRARTASGYRSLCRLYVWPRLGHVPLHRLAPPAIDALYVSLFKDRGLAPATVAKIAAILHAALAAAVRTGLLLKNPADQTAPPRPQPYDATILTIEQIGQYLDDVDQTTMPGLRAFYYTAIDTGCRLGELLSCREADVDLVGGILSVRKTLQRAGREPVTGPTKSVYAIRAIKLSHTALDTIRVASAWRKEQRLRLGSDYRDAGFLFCGPTGRPFNSSNLRNRDHYPRLLRLRLPKTRIHDLRHANATHLTAAGVDPRTLADRLGHSRASFTMNRYSHASTRAQERAAAVANELLTKRGQSGR